MWKHENLFFLSKLDYFLVSCSSATTVKKFGFLSRPSFELSKRYRFAFCVGCRRKYSQDCRKILPRSCPGMENGFSDTFLTAVGNNISKRARGSLTVLLL